MTIKARTSSPVSVSAVLDDLADHDTKKNKETTRINRHRWPSSSTFALVLVSFLLGLLVANNTFRSTPCDYSQFQGVLRNLQQPQQHDALDVLIVGAGWAGIAAGNRLLELGIESFELFEARDYAGGRSRTAYPFAQQPDLAVEVGSAWTYEDTEPHELMLAQDLPYGEVLYDSKKFGLFDGRNGEITDKTTWQQLDRIAHVLPRSGFRVSGRLQCRRPVRFHFGSRSRETA